MSATLKKAIATAGVILIIVLFIVYQRGGTADPSSLGPVSDAPSDTSGTEFEEADSEGSESVNPGDVAAGVDDDLVSHDPSAPTTPAPRGGYKDGTYTGPAVDALYGPIQVRAVIRDGRLADIEYLQYPNTPGNTTRISEDALPKMEAQAIAIQSAQVDNITGATQTVDGFQQTLQIALNQAKA